MTEARPVRSGNVSQTSVRPRAHVLPSRSRMLQSTNYTPPILHLQTPITQAIIICNPRRNYKEPTTMLASHSPTSTPPRSPAHSPTRRTHDHARTPSASTSTFSCPRLARTLSRTLSLSLPRPLRRRSSSPHSASTSASSSQPTSPTTSRSASETSRSGPSFASTNTSPTTSDRGEQGDDSSRSKVMAGTGTDGPSQATEAPLSDSAKERGPLRRLNTPAPIDPRRSPSGKVGLRVGGWVGLP